MGCYCCLLEERVFSFGKSIDDRLQMDIEEVGSICTHK